MPRSPISLDEDELLRIPIGFCMVKRGKVLLSNKPFQKYFFNNIIPHDVGRQNARSSLGKYAPFKLNCEGGPAPTNHKLAAVDLLYRWEDAEHAEPEFHIPYEAPDFTQEQLYDLQRLPTFRREFRFRMLEVGSKEVWWIDEITVSRVNARQIKEADTAADSLIRQVHTGSVRPPEGVNYWIDQQLGALGGDFYFIRSTRDNRYTVFCVGDAAGKGVKAAMISLLAGVKLGELARDPLDWPDTGLMPARSITDPVARRNANTALRLTKRLDEFLTNSFGAAKASERSTVGLDAMVCVFDHRNEEMTVAQGNFLLWRLRDGTVTQIGAMAENVETHPGPFEAPKSGKTIGAGWHGEFEAEALEFRRTDVFFAASDGVYRQINGKLPPERFGQDGFRRALETAVARQRAALSDGAHSRRLAAAEEVVEELRMGVRAYMETVGGVASAVDDQMIIALVLPESSTG